MKRSVNHKTMPSQHTTQVIIALCAFLAANANLYKDSVYEYMLTEHVKNYNIPIKDGVEFALRTQIFVSPSNHGIFKLVVILLFQANNYDKIHLHNLGNHTFSLGLNQFAHLDVNEFRQKVHSGCFIQPSYNRKPPGSYYRCQILLINL